MPYEILEHTADVGIRATGGTVEEVFEQTARALAEIEGIWAPAHGEAVAVELEGHDVAGLLVDWLSEILWLQESRDGLLCGVEVGSVTQEGLKARLHMCPRGEGEIEGTQVKAATYHRLKVEETSSGYVAEVYLDV